MSIRSQLAAILSFIISSISCFSYAQSSSKSVVINTIDYPPYSILGSADDTQGHDIEVITKALEYQGISVEFNVVPIKRSLVELKDGNVFGMTICGKTEEREKFLYFTDPISAFNLGFIYQKGSTDLKDVSWDEIKKRNLTISTVRGFVAEKELTLNDIDTYLVVSLDRGIIMTGLNRIQVFYAGMEASSELAKKLNFHEGFEYARAPGHSYYENHLCVSKKWPRAKELILEFNAGLQAIKSNGIYYKIRQEHKSISEWDIKSNPTSSK